MDRLDAARRSANMAKVRGKNTGPELAVRRIAHSIGLRFRLHRKDLPGSPDLVFPRHRLVVFVHGCFWHRHEDCRRATMPATRKEFWEAKFAGTIQRDRDQKAKLEVLGWRVLTLWECELKDRELVATTLSQYTASGAFKQPQGETVHPRPLIVVLEGSNPRTGPRARTI